jgi:hypothetical protein
MDLICCLFAGRQAAAVDGKVMVLCGTGALAGGRALSGEDIAPPAMLALGSTETFTPGRPCTPNPRQAHTCSEFLSSSVKPNAHTMSISGLYPQNTPPSPG